MILLAAIVVIFLIIALILFNQTFNFEIDNNVPIIFVCNIILLIFISTILIGGNVEIKTKKMLKPDIKIEIENGIADTTYIYSSYKIKNK